MPRRLTRTAAGCFTMLLAATMTPAYAAKVSTTDKHGDAPAQSDIVKATFAYTSDYLAAKVTIDDLDPTGIVMLKFAYESVNGPEARSVITVKATKRAGHKPKVRVSYYRETGFELDCPDTVVAWNQPGDWVSFKVTPSCFEDWYGAAAKLRPWAAASNLNGGGKDRTKEVVVKKG
jgi:hypothetical protein